MSPYCPGRTIASCPSQAARTLEDEILASAQSGKDRETIEGELVERFGPEIVGYQGSPVLVWGSALGALLAVGWLWTRARRWTGAGGAGSTAPAPAPEQSDALEDALDDLPEF